METVTRIFRKELLQVFRDRKLVFSTLVLPVLLMPVFAFGPTLFFSRILERSAKEVQEVAARGLPQEALLALEAQGLKPVLVEDPRGAVEKGAYPAGVEYGGGAYRVYGRLAGGPGEGQVAVGKVEKALALLKEEAVAEALKAKGVPLEVLTPFRVEVVDASPERERAAGLLGFLLPFFLVIFILSGGQVVAVDATAGEKEKGTLEALLSAPVPLPHLALGKALATVAMALLSGSAGLLGLALGGLLSGRLEGAMELGGRVALTGGEFLALFVTGFLLALFMGAVMVALGLYARSFKEAQSYMAPLQLLVLFPLLFLQFRGFFTLEAWHHLVPVLNVALLMDGLFRGQAEPLSLALTWGSTLVYAALAFLLAVGVFRREEVVFRN
ncbi:MAG: ABC transporter permease subunit [Thermus sp.]|uniref:ABC transporter permease n=1 Tax=Thermus sp. TaxID=275 RepID=UPI003097A11D